MSSDTLISICSVCEQPTDHEYYMVKHHIWKEAGSNPYCCIGCLEERLGRKLTSEDFLPCLLNEHIKEYPKATKGRKLKHAPSKRLLDRIKS